MRKAIVIMIALILLLGLSGCESLREAGRVSQAPPAKDEEVPPAKDEFSEADITNAGDIATAINAYNCLNPNSVIPDGVTLDDVKEALYNEGFWPQLSDKDAEAAWKLIIYKDGIAELTTEAQELAQELKDEPERITDEGAMTYLNACNIATAINAYNALNPDSVLPGNITLKDAKETVGPMLWPSNMSDEEERAAWELIVYKDGVADLVPEAQQGFEEWQSGL